jgi:putative membrane protein
VIAIVIIVRLVLGTRDLTSIVEYVALAEIILLISIEFDVAGLKGRSNIGTFRRLSAISVVSNILWLLLAVLALIDFSLTGSVVRFFALLITGFLFAISFRAFIFGAAFYGSAWHGLPLAFIQPLLLSIPTLFVFGAPGFSLVYFGVAISTGVAYLVCIEAYLYFINRSPSGRSYNPLQLLQAFLDAWTLEDATRLEVILDRISTEGLVSTELLSIRESKGTSVVIVVPGVHPGPFYPVGSSNLPADIYSKLRTPSVTPLTVHSVSDHDLNLPSKSEVENYVSSLTVPEVVESGKLMSRVISKTRGKSTVTGIAFEKTCLVAITLAPNGMEDLPTRVRSEIETLANSKGFNLCLVIDTHNSEGVKPTGSETDDIISCAEDVLDELSNSETVEFKLGFAHSSELEKARSNSDIGPAGVGLMLFESTAERFCFVLVDANNAKLGFREQILQGFQAKTGTKLVELFTSDTHVTAAKARGPKGYLALGDVTPVEDFVLLLSTLYARALPRVSDATFTSEVVKSKVKTIGSQILSDFSSLADNTSATAKRGAQILAILGIAIVILTII